jgi:hypothetical protein
MSGRAWEALRQRADEDAGTPNVSDQNQSNNVDVLAKALVYARTGEARYRTEVRQNCMAAIDTELGGRTLALGRELAAYVIAADLVGLSEAEDQTFRAWLRRTLTEVLDGRTLQSTHEERANNWGTHAGASRAAVAAYLGDAAELERTAQVFRGWVGERDVYAGFFSTVAATMLGTGAIGRCCARSSSSSNWIAATAVGAPRGTTSGTLGS